MQMITRGMKKKVLIVDDVELVRVFLGAILDLYEMSGEFAANGQEAINEWEKEEFSAILMDLDMPIMGGLEATRIIRKRERDEKRKHTPIIAVSGTEMEDPRAVCFEAGMDAFLPKPVLIRDVLDVVFPLIKKTSNEGESKASLHR